VNQDQENAPVESGATEPEAELEASLEAEPVAAPEAAAPEAALEAAAPETAVDSEPSAPKAAAPEAALEQAPAAAAPDSPTDDAPVGAAAATESATPAVQRGRPRLKLEDLAVGAETKGKVMRVADFGAFVDIGAVTDGLVHVTEIADRRVRKVEDVVKSGDTVDVWIKEIDHAKGRISLSMKRRPTRPMDALRVGEPLTGRVKSLTKYGAFVDIGSETDGLVHVSEMGSGFTQSPSEVAQVGAEVEVWVKEVDAKAKRISLSMKDPSAGAAAPRSKTKSRSEPARDEIPEEPPGPAVPTMMELALRKALGEPEDEDDTAEAADPASAPAKPDSLGQVYARMLEEYRAQRGDG
jgi:predicted RNA-binding protein with RPS1 domain